MYSGSGWLCPLSTLKGVSFQAGVSEVFLIAIFVRELPETVLDYIHIGVGALWAPIRVEDVSECH